MGAKFWSAAEDSYFMHTVLPRSNCSTGTWIKGTGKDWPTLAAQMQRDLDASGESRRVYHGQQLFQQYNRRFCTSAFERGTASQIYIDHVSRMEKKCGARFSRGKMMDNDPAGISSSASASSSPPSSSASSSPLSTSPTRGKTGSMLTTDRVTRSSTKRKTYESPDVSPAMSFSGSSSNGCNNNDHNIPTYTFDGVARLLFVPKDEDNNKRRRLRIIYDKTKEKSIAQAKDVATSTVEKQYTKQNEQEALEEEKKRSRAMREYAEKMSWKAKQETAAREKAKRGAAAARKEAEEIEMGIYAIPPIVLGFGTYGKRLLKELNDTYKK